MNPWHIGCQEELEPRVCETPWPARAWSLALWVGQLLATRTPVREAAKTRPEAPLGWQALHAGDLFEAPTRDCH